MSRFTYRRSILLAVALAVPFALCSGAAWSDQPGQGGAPGAESPDAADIFFGELQKRLISSYYERHVYTWEHSPEGHEYKKGKKNKHKRLPPGLAKKGMLPPGIAKQLVRNGQLPPGLEYHDLPRDLVVQLPPIAYPYRYVIADDRVMLIQAASNLILDVLTVAAIEVLD
jgi:hypothetical protein